MGEGAAKAPRRQGRRQVMGLQEPGPIADGLAAAVVDAAVEVHRHLGPAYSENVYESALSHEPHSRQVPFERQVVVPVVYKGLKVGEGRIDLLVGLLVVVELKALPVLDRVHTAQLLSYLKATGLVLGLLLNFGQPHMRSGIRRFVRTP
jgi:GxxExxY protein